MKIAVFHTKPHDEQHLKKANEERGNKHDLTFLEPRLTPQTVSLASGFDAVCCFVNDEITAEVVATLKQSGIKLLALRCAGFNNVDLEACDKEGIVVGRVPGYSPNAVAEHALALILSLNRKIPRAVSQTRYGNFTLKGLAGFDLCNATIGVVGTGKIGYLLCKALVGIGSTVVAYDLYESDQVKALGVKYLPLEEVYKQCDVISLHLPLTPETNNMIGEKSLGLLKPGVLIVNTSRGQLVDTRAAIKGLKEKIIGGLAVDVYANESGIFFEDQSDQPIMDDELARLLSFPNVLVTPHMAFFTREALVAIANTTLDNIDQFEKDGSVPSSNHVSAPKK